MASYQHEIEAAAAALRSAVNALPAGPAKTAMRAASEGMIRTLADAQYNLRDGYELPRVQTDTQRETER